MTRAEIDAMLRRAITEAGGVAKDIVAPREARMLAACVAGLALVLRAQEQRLRAMEASAEHRDKAVRDV